MTGVDLPSPSMDQAERQLQLKQVATAFLTKLDPGLSVHKLAYVRVIKTPRPSILEVECESVERFVCCLYHFILSFENAPPGIYKKCQNFRAG
jgi:hypothetical protein